MNINVYISPPHTPPPPIEILGRNVQGGGGGERPGAKRPGAKRPGGEMSRGGNGFGAKRPGTTRNTGIHLITAIYVTGYRLGID